ncbi:MAG: sodium:calcium antiporter [Lachnospiraceae bacterium]|nr:sodium:calcium antiporter [Lachnospiraceae bacterium]
MEVGYYILMFALGLGLLVWGSDLFVDSAIALANRFHLSEVLIGATIVSLGTTLPETLFSTIASVQGLPEMALGNALGSILCNTGLIAGIMLTLKPIVLDSQSAENMMQGGLFLGAGFFIYAVSGLLTGGLTRSTGIILLLLCIFYMVNTVWNARKAEEDSHLEQSTEQSFGVSDIIRIFLEAAGIYIGADILVKYGPKIAGAFGIPEMIISLTFVALGTSLPELVTSLVALRKKHSALSLGNIIGADILNFVLVGGISAVICPSAYPESIMKLELPSIFGLLFLMCVPSILWQKAGRAQGILMLGGYIMYLILMGIH